jgi:hypothetical protein
LIPIVDHHIQILVVFIFAIQFRTVLSRIILDFYRSCFAFTFA